MLIFENCDREHLRDVVAFAIRTGKMSLLRKTFKYLSAYCNHTNPRNTRCALYRDFAPMSFAFSMQRWDETKEEYVPWFPGGIIYRGGIPENCDGSAPVFSVHIGNEQGWSIDT